MNDQDVAVGKRKRDTLNIAFNCYIKTYCAVNALEFGGNFFILFKTSLFSGRTIIRGMVV